MPKIYRGNLSTLIDNHQNAYLNFENKRRGESGVLAKILQEDIGDGNEVSVKYWLFDEFGGVVDETITYPVSIEGKLTTQYQIHYDDDGEAYDTTEIIKVGEKDLLAEFYEADSIILRVERIG